MVIILGEKIAFEFDYTICKVIDAQLHRIDNKVVAATWPRGER